MRLWSAATLFNSFTEGGGRAGSLGTPGAAAERAALGAPHPFMEGVLNCEEDRTGRAAMKVLPPAPPQPCTEESCYRRLSGPTLSQVQEESVCESQPAVCPGQPGEEDVRKRGYLRKQKHGHKRYFVLRSHSHLGPARLEYYDNEKKFRSGQRPGGGAGCSPKRVIFLSQCFTVSRRADAKNKHLLALYTKDEYFAMVAESEQDQDSWYQALSELINENKKLCLDSEELEDNYGGLRTGPVFKEVWQVNVKPRGLGQTKNLSGVYRLCLSNKAVHLVKLNCDVACVHLLLMNIRRCGHSENYFFIEVGRSSSTGAGELWMQVDDCVVAQNMHETFLETMKALKAYPEFRPRSKSQSSGTNPISFITTRRYLGNLPPSQTGLQRRSRTESVTGTPPATKSNSYRFRTSSEGEGTMTRPFRSVTGSLIHLNTARINLGKQEGTGRYVRAPFNSGYHSRSASLPVSHFPSATSPISVCSSSGHGSASDTLTRPSSSICGSPSDGGFISSDEYGSSPGDLRYFRVRSNTPDSLGNTPPIQEENTLSDYMSMSSKSNPTARDDYMEADKSFRKRTYSLTKPTNATLQQKSQAAVSLDEDSEEINKQFAYSESPKLKDSNHPEDYTNGIDSVCNQSRSKAKDDGYMPMMPSISYDNDYLPMAPKSVSAPKQIVSRFPSQVDSKGYMMMFPSAGSPVKNSVIVSLSKGNQERVPNGEYMDMSYGSNVTVKQTDSNVSNSRGFSSYFSLPRSFKSSSKHSSDNNEYVPMSSPGKLGMENVTDVCKDRDANGISKIELKSSNSVMDEQVKAMRPTKLTLAMRGSSTVPRLFDHSNSAEPISPGEYINIDFSDKASSTPYSLSAEGSPSSLGSSCDHRQSPLSDYMSVDIDVQSPKATTELPNSLTDISSYSCTSISRIQPSVEYAKLPCGTACVSTTNRNDDYTTMTFNMAMTPPRPFPNETESGTKLDSPSSIVNQLCIGDMSSFNSGFPPVLNPMSEPVVGPKVIRADQQGRRRHSSETFSSAGTVTTSSSCFTESGKRHSSASFDNVWLKPDESSCDQEKKMSKNSSTGFQNGLNYIALSMHDGICESTSPACSQHQNGSRNVESGAYVSIDFSRSDCLKCSAFRKETDCAAMGTIEKTVTPAFLL
ncbi:insulin receptor substrate 4 [Mixophyes fleayi]|uniref:insulin receptor substrate 4 n=1 Tax=Mixophyes fleayi TaxID=3061075 RepID=UPI003F4D71F3